LTSFFCSSYPKRRSRLRRSASEPCVRVSTSHGSSVICVLSLKPLQQARDLSLHAFPLRVIHTSPSGVLIAYSALLIPITRILPSPRLHIRQLSRRLWLLGESLSLVASS